ncbi:MAG: tRNA 5-methoxyuridine(34)/uridine 5-oxyacetic acid(34) synthase CmoB [Gammaproteobacteria bacterium]
MSGGSPAPPRDACLEAMRDGLARALPAPLLAAWLDDALAAVPPAWHRDRRRAAWEGALAALPPLVVTATDFRSATVSLRGAAPATGAARAALHAALAALHPWRKGPFDLFGVAVDAEWRSDLKWTRLAAHVSPLAGRRVLDVGCGNGYYAWRMLGAGAHCVVGLDPGLLPIMQFRAVHHYQPHAPIVLLPLASAALDRPLGCFDSVFSMGVLYHRRDPLAHLRELRRALGADGELVLETLVIDRVEAVALNPGGRYARMPNVWQVPSPALVEAWLRAAGFTDVRIVDVTATTPAEQRSTPWMRFESFAECLAPGDPTRTVEGHPAPLRALFLARPAGATPDPL